ncbi:lovastatin diketide synthase LovF [Diplogelasinospora grovesii]|uniref:Lovastatin diketide synthase LovF n=1 Tax=Diplogelasinospora grovesii TaxID=303347 RepID=A0AAN6S1T3_9PEZI|nr:lovastatin diketide synthase LovF [Diplogelasinospora grovesii]
MSTTDSNMPIAIVGMSCRFAGDVDNPEKLWELVSEGRSAWSEIPSSRFSIDGVLHANADKLNATNVIGGHFLTEDVGLFDAQFFNLSAETAAALDPQFRLQLETTFEAMESAGIRLQDVAGSNTSVFAGSFFRDYHESLVKDPDSLPRFLLMGTGAAMASNRLSHFFDLRGPSMSIDTGCSTTLTALHQGCQSLRSGESDMSIVGGANVMFNPDMFMTMSSLGLISKDGRSYAFDSRANGYGRGEGSATVILKRLDDAIRDGDPIRAIIRDSGVNQDGKTETITTPSGEAQEALIRACYRRAGLDPAETTYFEAHGTGTPTGDPIEVKAIASVFKGTRDEPLRIGSVKTNIGHTETASGVAAIIKVALALEKGQIPPSINFEKPNKKLQLDEWRLKVPTELESWPDKAGIRRASINNFGYGGSNAHVIMEEYHSFMSSGPRQKTLTNSVTNGNGYHTNGNGVTNGHTNGTPNGDSEHSDARLQSRVFILSARDEQATRNMADNLKDYLLHKTGQEDEGAFLDSLAFTLGQRRSLFPWVSTFSGDSIPSLAKTVESGRVKPSRTAGAPPRLGFVFTGQGAQWWAMGRELIDVYPVFKAALLDCDGCLKGLGAKWSMIEELSRDEKTTRVNQLDYSTPVCVSVQIALVQLLRSWGISPTAVTSHSSGEIAAAYVAGALDLKSAMAIVHARGGLAADSNRQHARKGGMVAVGLGVEAGRKYLSQVSSGQVMVACENSPSSITVSGDVCGLDQLEAMLKTENVFARRLKVDAAWHSHHMEAVADAYYNSMAKNNVKSPQSSIDGMVFSSPSTGKRMDDAEEIGSPAHWVRSLTGPVLFVDAFRNMCFDGVSAEPAIDMAIEVGPHAALSGPIQDIMASLPEFRGVSIPYGTCLVRKKSAVDTMHTLVCDLLQRGYPVNLAAVNFPHGSHGLKVLHDLPRYPWNHQTRFWTEPRVNRANRNRIEGAPHDLLGSLVLGTNLNAPSWRHIVRANDLPWVRDHVVQNNMIYPGAGFIAMAIEGMAFQASQQGGGKKIVGYHLRDIDMAQALVVPETSGGVELQLQLRPCSDKAISTQGWTEFQVQSVNADNKWTDHCRGIISVEYASANGKTKQLHELNQPTKTCEYRARVRPQDLYAGMRSGGICHGPIFRNLKSIRARSSSKQSITTFAIADSAAVMPKQHQHEHVVHPTTLDSVFQAAYTAIPGAGSKMGTPKVPRSISKLWIAQDVSKKAGHRLRAYSQLSHIDSQRMETAITVFDEAQAAAEADDEAVSVSAPVMISLEGFVCQSIGNAPDLPEAEPHENDKFAVTKWAPDITFMKQAFLQKQLGTDVSPEEAETLVDLRKLCMFYICDALRELTGKDLQRLEWYHKKFYIWMRLQVELARQNELAPNSSEWILASANAKEKAALLQKARADSTNGEMVCHLGPHIASVLRGELTALELMMEDNLLQRYYLDGLKWGRANEKLSELVKHYVHKNPRAKMIEIGAGTGGATTHVLQNAIGRGNEPRVGSYDFTDVSSGFFEAAKDKFQDWDGLMRYKKLDIEQDPAAQGFEEGTYDVVIACQCLHATKSMDNTMANVRKLLKPGGKLFIMETTQDQLDIQFVFGFLQGWWLSEEEERKFSPSLTVPMWDRVLHRSGFRGVEAEVRDCDSDELYSFSVMSSTATAPLASPRFDFDIVFVTAAQSIADSDTDSWLDRLRVSIGLLTCTVPIVQSLEEGVDVDENTICVFVDHPENPVLANPTTAQFEGIKTLSTKTRGLLWVTRGGVVECENPLASLATGFLRSLREEYCGKRLGSVDLDPAQPLWSSESVTAVTEVFRRLFDYSATGNPEVTDYEFADRNGVIHIPRYVKDVQRNKAVFHEPSKNTQPVPQPEPFVQADRPLRLTIGTTGLLDTLAFDDDPSVADALPEDHIEVEPKAFGVNFRDVMVAMGQLKSRTMGYDCAGVVRSVGPAAAEQGFKVGDRVTMLLVKGHYGSITRCHWSSACRIPEDMDFQTAASLPTQYVAAYVSLYDNARLQKGETVLIHSATGGVGQAAVMMAQRVGAEIFVTVGSEEKRQFVMQHFNIPADHIFSSRDTSFAAGVMAMTRGRGVDVVLNSLAGVLLQESFNCLAPFGRFVELGKRDLELNNSLALEAFTRAVSFSSVDVLALGEHKPMDMHRVMKDCVRLVADKEISPVHPITAYPISEVEKAFRLMQAGKHMGKIVLSVSADDMVPVLPQTTTTKLKPDASYLIVGGFGGIGRSICRWMVEHGARNLVILSRSAGTQQKINELLSEIGDVGKDVRVKAIGCDISDLAQLQNAMKQCWDEGIPPIKGVIHGGMELRDSVLEKMGLNDHNAALDPKLRGSWNLHQCFADVDFFIMLSSLAGIVGLASQCNYSAGSTFQDALAQHRTTKLNQPAVSIDLGIVKNIGYLADLTDEDSDRTVQKLQRQGHMLLDESDVLSAIGSAIQTPYSGQLLLGLNTGPLPKDGDGPMGRDGRFTGLQYRTPHDKGTTTVKAGGGGSDIAGQLQGAGSFEEAVSVVVEGVQRKLMDIFMIATIDEVDPGRSAADFGVDSLVAVELRNMLAIKCGAGDLSIFDIMQSSSLVELASGVAGRSSHVDPSLLPTK